MEMRTMNDEILSGKNQIEILEKRKNELLERQHICKDVVELKEIEKQLKKIETLLNQYQKTEAKLQRMKKE